MDSNPGRGSLRLLSKPVGEGRLIGAVQVVIIDGLDLLRSKAKTRETFAVDCKSLLERVWSHGSHQSSLECQFDQKFVIQGLQPSKSTFVSLL